MAIDKKQFLKTVTVLYDTREQQNAHILCALAEIGVPTERRKLDYGDYSFVTDGRDFSLSCVIERKANVDELYANIMSDRGRLEKEFYAAAQLAKSFTLLIEGVGAWEELKAYAVPDWAMKRNPERKVAAVGAPVYSTLRAWTSRDRYGAAVEFVKNREQSAARMLEVFYYYWRSYKEMTAARGNAR